MAIVDGHIRCSRCGEIKPIGEYQPKMVKAGCGTCRPCKYAQKRAYEGRNRTKVNAARSRLRKADPNHKARMRAHYRSNPEKYRGYSLNRYGITAADYDAILAVQGGRCACCGGATNRDGRRLFVDHDHATGAVRGILCNGCNRGIGLLGDTIDGLRRALNYLERAQQQPPSRAVRVPSMRINLLQGVN